MSEQQKEYLDQCVDALDHIMRTARAARVTSKRLSWIGSRAESAINGNEDWRSAPVPVNGEAQLFRARTRIKEIEAQADLRNLVYASVQFDHRGETDLKFEEISRLVARGWMAEGEENDQFDITDAGQSAIETAMTAIQSETEDAVALTPYAREEFEDARDAARYRWLRDNAYEWDGGIRYNSISLDDFIRDGDLNLDEAIDSIMPASHVEVKNDDEV